MYVFHLAEVFSAFLYSCWIFHSGFLLAKLEQAMEEMVSVSPWDQQKSAKLGSSQAKKMLYCGKS